MYQVDVLTEGTAYPLYRPGASDLQLIEPKLELEINKAGVFTFGIAAAHPNRRFVKPVSSEIYVYRGQEVLFCGRAMTPEEDFDNTGVLKCEGELAYLHDSVQRPYDHTGGIGEFFAKVLQDHNSQVEPRKQFLKGIVGVAGADENIQRSDSGYSSSLEALRNKLTNVHGGCLRVRREAGKKYLDYVTDYGGTNSQTIRFGEGLLDINRRLDASEVVTCLIPAGGRVESLRQKDAKGKAENQKLSRAAAASGREDKRVDIASVNNGLDYICDADAVARYGKIWGSQEFPDALTPESLLKKARAYLEESVALPQTITLNAVDLSLIHADAEQIRLGWWTRVESAPHSVTGTFLTSKLTLHLTQPEKDEITLGKTVPTLSGSVAKQQAEVSEKVQSIADSASREINRKVENATNLITGGLGGYIVIGMADADQHPEEILIMDAPDKAQARNVIRLNKNGLGFSTTGYNGVYKNAWTIDGNLAADFITSGTMLADRIRGGALEVGGTGLGTDGSIVVKDAANRVAATLNKEGLKVYNGSIEGSRITGSEITGGTIKGTEIKTNVFRADDGSFVVESHNNSLDELNRMYLYRDTDREGHYEAGVQPGGIYEKINDDSVQLSGGVVIATGEITSGSALKGQAAVIKGNIDAGGTITANSQAVVSDRDRKKDIQKADAEKLKALAMRLQACMFRYKESDDGLHCGFIYQDVEPLIQELGLSDFTLCKKIADGEGREKKVMSYAELIPVCIMMIQELYERIGNLEK